MYINSMCELYATLRLTTKYNESYNIYAVMLILQICCLSFFLFRFVFSSFTKRRRKSTRENLMISYKKKGHVNRENNRMY